MRLSMFEWKRGGQRLWKRVAFVSLLVLLELGARCQTTHTCQNENSVAFPLDVRRICTDGPSKRAPASDPHMYLPAKFAS